MKLNEFILKFSDTMEIDEISAITAETKFRDLDEWSSLSIMLLIALFDEEFNIEIGDTDLKKCSTIMDLYNLINA